MAASSQTKKAVVSNAEQDSAVSSEETATDSIIGDSEQVYCKNLCDICVRGGVCACDTCLQIVCLRCAYTGRHDDTPIRSYVRLC